ncbi:uncharacterized protein LOC143183344 [Calliopsis andreniformis]|uniref:uncharacterized protein LOC143183344 n=1 Tax=Calliopsis andreniformis TaxID=337506 RepID=UPI003FCE85C4
MLKHRMSRPEHASGEPKARTRATMHATFTDVRIKTNRLAKTKSHHLLDASYRYPTEPRLFERIILIEFEGPTIPGSRFESLESLVRDYYSDDILISSLIITVNVQSGWLSNNNQRTLLVPECNGAAIVVSRLLRKQ